MIADFQNTPTWLVIVFLVIWIFGWFFLFVKKRKSTQTPPKEKMLINLTGFSIGIGMCYLTLNWAKTVLLSGLCGIHAGFVAGIYIFTLIFICQSLAGLICKFSKNFLSDN